MANLEKAATPDLVNRVRNILMRPKQEWRVIDAEQTDLATLYRRYVIPLAAIGPIATAIGSSLFGVTLPFGGGTIRTPITNAITQAIVSYVLALVATYVLALVIDNLAPSFSGTRSMTQALKVAAYSSTAQWLAGVFAIIPALAVLTIVGLYSLYLLYLGLPVLMKVPQERALTYTVAVLVVAVVLFILIGLVTGAILGFGVTS